MGWASGSDLASEVEEAIEEFLEPLDFFPQDAAVTKMYRRIAAAFMKFDCDTLEECGGRIGDAANRMFHEKYGAPARPSNGEVWRDRFEDSWQFDGNRWRWLDEQ